MSAFISLISPEGAYLLTDGAVYREHVLIEVRQKATCARLAPLAVTTRGGADRGEALAKEICALADQRGAAATMEQLQDFAKDYQRRHGVIGGNEGLQVLVSAFVQGVGGMHRTFLTRPERYRAGASVVEVPAYQLVEPPEFFAQGSRIHQEDLIANGLMRLPTEPMADFARRGGLGIMELMRSRPGRDMEDDQITFTIGGHCQLTTISARRCRTETLRIWPDEIGKPIDPFRVTLAANSA